MPKTVLIARPHPFIVDAMKPFLEELGFATQKLDRVSDLGAKAANTSGAVISLALSSSIPESAEEVFSSLRRASTRVPVLFASMLEPEQANAALAKIAKMSGHVLNALNTKSPSSNWAKLGSQETFVYLSKDDLTSPERRAVAAKLVQRHFG